MDRFRLACIILFVLLASIGFYHRFRASRAEDRISQREEGLPVMILLRIFGFSVWVGILLYMIDPRWMAWSSLPLPHWLRWAGAGLCLITIPLIYWMFSHLGGNVTDTVVTRKAHRLVTSGPYRWIRHPMYLFSIFMFVGFSLLTANWFIALAGMLAVIMLIIRTPTEEAMLLEKFGEGYRRYMERTGRFWPRQ